MGAEQFAMQEGEQSLEEQLRKYSLEELELRVLEVTPTVAYVKKVRKQAYAKAVQNIRKEQAEQDYDDETAQRRLQEEGKKVLHQAYVILYTASIQYMRKSEKTLFYEQAFPDQPSVEEEYIVPEEELTTILEEDESLLDLDDLWENFREKLTKDQLAVIERTINRMTAVAAEYLEVSRGDIYEKLHYAITYNILEETYEQISKKVDVYVKKINFEEPSDNKLWEKVRKEFRHLKDEREDL